MHRVCLKAFELGRYEVTQAEWRRIMVFPNSNPSSLKGGDRLPVESVSWDEAQRFVWLMSFFGSRQYRLPSEAEWEYAARAGTTTARYWGERAEDGCGYENMADLNWKKEKPEAEVVKCETGKANPAPVGSYRPNPWSIYDMLGNVAEWVVDCYVHDYRRASVDGSPNISIPCRERVNRGGSWYDEPSHFRAATRDGNAPDFRDSGLGLRVARTGS